MEGHRTRWLTGRAFTTSSLGNGRQPSDLVELAVVPIVGGIIDEPTSWLVRPDTPVTARARSIHGITNAQVADLPVFADIEADVIQALNGSALIAHNAHVDIGVLRRKLGTWECREVFDTLKLARRQLPCGVRHPSATVPPLWRVLRHGLAKRPPRRPW
ncbi:MAG: 3'-5' exonuclease [Pseudonocardiaceae bacterium]